MNTRLSKAYYVQLKIKWNPNIDSKKDLQCLNFKSTLFRHMFPCEMFVRMNIAYSIELFIYFSMKTNRNMRFRN